MPKAPEKIGLFLIKLLTIEIAAVIALFYLIKVI